jgi:hypothetical protein
MCRALELEKQGMLEIKRAAIRIIFIQPLC